MEKVNSSAKLIELDEQGRLLKDLRQVEKEKRILEVFYQGKLEKLERKYLSKHDECNVLRTDSNFMMQEILKTEKQAMLGKFASILAHDIRTPLTIIQTTMDLLNLSPIIGSNEKNKYFPMVKKSLKRINELVEDVLGYVRDHSLEIKPYSIIEILKSTLELCDLPSSIKVILPKNDYTIPCDGRKLKSVFSNLIINASQSIKQKGEIKIKLKNTEKRLIVTVTDSGPGIPEDEFSSIFEPLFTTKEHGTGLGLSICQKIIHLHNGDISVKNNPTTFTINLPNQQS